jgi:signal transduction histidine kinase
VISVRQKNILPFLLILISLASVYVFFILNQHTNLLKAELSRKGKSVLENFAAASQVDILLQDTEPLLSLIEQTSAKDEDINAACIYISSSEVFLSNDSTLTLPQNATTPQTYETNQYLFFTKPINDQLGEPIGVVGVTVSKTRINTILYKTGLRLGLVAFVSFTLVVFFVNFLSKRLRIMGENAVIEAQRIEEAYLELQSLQGELEATNASLEGRVKLRTQELSQANEDFETANGELKEFAYIVSHDLKAPLRAIDALTEWIVEDYEEALDEEGKNLIQTLKERVTTMNKLIDGILQYSRISRMDPNIEIVDLNTVAQRTWELLKPSEQYALIVKKELPTLEISFDKIQEVFFKIFENAIRFNDKPKRLVTIDWAQDRNNLLLHIRDNGIGIAERDFDEIFKIFRTVDKKMYPNQIGLGLTLAKRIVEFYGGTLTVQSVLGEGSTFTISLPNERV